MDVVNGKDFEMEKQVMGKASALTLTSTWADASYVMVNRWLIKNNNNNNNHLHNTNG